MTSGGRLCARPSPVPALLALAILALANLAFTGQEHENVARTLAPEVLRRADDRLLEFLLVVGFLVGARRADVAAEGPAPHLVTFQIGAFRADAAKRGAAAAPVELK